MFVMQLIGRQADTVIDMPYAEAKACIDNGTARRATEDEITAEMERTTAPVTNVSREQLLAGYRMEPNEAGGYDVFDAGGVKVSQEPLRNQLEAQNWVLGYSSRVRGLPDDLFTQTSGGEGAGGDGDVDYSKKTVEDLQKIAADRGIDSSGAKKKADWVDLLERDDKVKKALADGEYEVLTIAELKKVAADRHIDLGDATVKADIIEKLKAPASVG